MELHSGRTLVVQLALMLVLPSEMLMDPYLNRTLGHPLARQMVSQLALMLVLQSVMLMAAK